MSEATQRNTAEVQQWYRTHETKAQIGFDPDGMCQKICRTARNIGPGAPSALASSLITPKEFRVYKIEDLLVGDVIYFDDPNDDNPFGHIVTGMARFKDRDPKSLRSIVTRTNSVKADHVVPVLGDYFPAHWGDKFVFGARWLNGEPFYDLLEKTKPRPKPKPLPRYERVEKAIDNLEQTRDLLAASILVHNRQKNTRYVRALVRDRARVKETLQSLRVEYNKARKE